MPTGGARHPPGLRHAQVLIDPDLSSTDVLRPPGGPGERTTIQSLTADGLALLLGLGRGERTVFPTDDHPVDLGGHPRGYVAAEHVLPHLLGLAIERVSVSAPALPETLIHVPVMLVNLGLGTEILHAAFQLRNVTRQLVARDPLADVRLAAHPVHGRVRRISAAQPSARGHRHTECGKYVRQPFRRVMQNPAARRAEASTIPPRPTRVGLFAAVQVEDRIEELGRFDVGHPPHGNGEMAAGVHPVAVTAGAEAGRHAVHDLGHEGHAPLVPSHHVHRGPRTPAARQQLAFQPLVRGEHLGDRHVRAVLGLPRSGNGPHAARRGKVGVVDRAELRDEGDRSIDAAKRPWDVVAEHRQDGRHGPAPQARVRRVDHPDLLVGSREVEPELIVLFGHRQAYLVNAAVVLLGHFLVIDVAPDAVGKRAESVAKEQFRLIHHPLHHGLDRHGPVTGDQFSDAHARHVVPGDLGAQIQRDHLGLA